MKEGSTMSRDDSFVSRGSVSEVRDNLYVLLQAMRQEDIEVLYLETASQLADLEAK